MYSLMTPNLVGFVLYALSFLAWLLALRRYEATASFLAFVGAGYAGVSAITSSSASR